MAVCKNLVRFAVIAGLVGGTAALVVGPDRLHALFHQTQHKINGAIDKCIDDPIALRAQMKSLEGQYPQRLADVRADLAELRGQKAQLKREREVSDRVVELAHSDITTLQALIDRGEQAETLASATNAVATEDGEGLAGGAQIVRVVFQNQSIPLKDAYTKAHRVQQVYTAYTSRATDIERDLTYLDQQEQRLTEVMAQLETEYSEFQAQIWQMDRQVDSISRNERLIGMMEKRQRTIDEQSRYQANSLEQISGRFSDIRARQEAKLEALGTATSGNNYEDRAKYDLDSRKAMDLRTRLDQPTKAKPNVIEITPADLKKTPKSAGGATAAVPSTSNQSLALKK